MRKRVKKANLTRSRKFKIGDKVKLKEGFYWPFSKEVTIVRIDNILSANSKRVLGYWYVVRHEADNEGTEERIVSSSYIES